MINSYVIDPAHIAPSRTDANSNGHFPPSNGQQPTGTPRGFNLQNYTMNSVLNLNNFPMAAMFSGNMLGVNPLAAAAGWHAASSDDRGGGPIRRGGAQAASGRFQNRAGPYDRRPNPRWGGDGNGAGMIGGRGRPGPTSRWGDGAAGGAAMGPREAVQGRTLKSYEDLDQVSGGGGGELNY